MAITAIIPTNLNFPNRGELERDAFVLAQEASQDLLAGGYTTNINLFATQANTLKGEVNVLAESSLNGSSVATTKASEASTSATNALNSKNSTELLFNQTKNLTDNLVIPTAATYTYTEANKRFRTKLHQFIGLDI